MAHVTNFKHELPSRYDTKKAKAVEAAAHELVVYKAVDVRDQRCCRVCGAKADPNAVGVLNKAHHHHIVYRSAGGPTETWNIVLLCAKCHNAEHKHLIKMEGNADEALTFWKKEPDAPVWFIWMREISVGQIEKD